MARRAKFNSCRSRPYYSRRCKQNYNTSLTATSIGSLPCELLFNILVHLSAEDIYNNAMLVCRNWCNIIRTHDFVQAHLQHSTPGILIRNYVDDHLSLVSVGQGGRVGVSKCSYGIENHDWYSCNGLILDSYVGHRKQPRLFNPATKQTFEIPQVPHPLGEIWMTIACSATSNQYKLVRTYCEYIDKDQKIVLCSIVTVGVDKSWRRLCTEYLSSSSKDLLFHSSAFTVGGFIHCVCPHSSGNYILTLNVETETFTENPIPQGLDKRFKFYLSSGKSLSLFTIGGLYYEAWDMKSETGEWTKMKIDLRPHKSKLEELFSIKDCGSNLVPCGWLKYQEVAVFRCCQPARFHIAYNVCTHEIDWFELASGYIQHQSTAHTSSLVGLV